MAAPLPTLSPEDRAAALEKALVVRHERAELKRRMKAREVTASEALADPVAAGLKVSEFLRSMPGVGTARAQRIMVDYGFQPNRRIGGLGVRQAEVMAEIARKHS